MRSGSCSLALRRPLPGLRIGLAAVALGATTYAAASALYLAAIERMGAGPAGVVSYCYPVLVMAGAIMLGRERLSRRRTAALALAVSGVGLLVAGGGLGAINAPGRPARVRLRDASTRPTCSPRPRCATGSSRSRSPRSSPPAPPARSRPPTPCTAARRSTPPLPRSPCVALALVPTAFAVSAFLSGLGRIGPSRASIASSVEPAVAVACGVLVLGERLVPIQFLGAGLVIAAVLAIEVRQLPRLPVPPLPRIRLLPRLVPRLPRPRDRRLGRRASSRLGSSGMRETRR